MLVAACLVLAAPAMASAQLVDGEDDAGDEEVSAQPEAHAEGEYGGVTPGEGTAPTKRKRPRRAVVTWVGYLDRGEDEGAGSRVFLQLNREVDIDQTVSNGKLYVTAAGARFGSKNARRRIDLRYFASPVREVTGRQAPRRRRATKRLPAGPAGAMLVFDFKDAAEAAPVAMSSRAEDDGYYYVFLDFPPGEAQRESGGDEIPAAGAE